MMGSYEITNQDQLHLLDPFKGSNTCKLRPLAPRLNLSPTTHNTCFHSTPTTTHHHFQSLNNTRPQHNHFGGIVGLSSEESNNKELGGTNQVMVSSRWNPTPEQLRALEELYRRGTRTPSAEQIQHITAQLRRYGKIEGKNVFYWFQNHKARERQKRRRQLQLPSTPGSSAARGNRVGFEGEPMSKWPPSTTNKESDRPITQIISEAATAADIKAAAYQTRTPTDNNNYNQWFQFLDPPQFQHNHTPNNINNNNNIMINISRNIISAGERNATCQSHNNPTVVQPLSQPCCCCTYPSPTTTFLSKINYLLPDKPVANLGNDVVSEIRASPPPCSPTVLQLFPINVDDDDDDEINGDDLGKEEERENDECMEKFNRDSCSSNNNNNHFPYYQFL